MLNSAVDNLEASGRLMEEGKAAKSYALFRSAETMAGSEENKCYNINSLRGPSRAEMVLPILVDYISDMKFEPGSKLPSEAELSNITGVSIKSLREALQTLRMLGLIQSRPGAGWYVTEFKPLINLPAVLAPVLERFSRVNIRKAFEARLGIEPVIAGLAVKNITPDGLVRLGKTLETMRENVAGNGISNEFKLADRKFHDILAEICDNEILSLQNSILSGLFLSMYLVIPDADKYGALREHEGIYKKIEAGDAEDVAMAAKRHVEWALQLIDKNG
ncbi:MAG: FCD domain-containing protein, partial [Sedimentisphaerales bacterium]|nr:FCD domain-containing protein [Sedimentisphaerales bacterium]